VKRTLKSLMTVKVHYLMFVLVCVLLVAVVLGAMLIADDISSIADRALQHANTLTLDTVAG
jgi:hypothetical protein